MIKNFDSLIKEEQEKLSKFKLQMDDLSQKFIKGIVEFTKEWFEKTAKDIIVENADKISELNIDQLKIIKDDVRNLINQSEQIINITLIKDDLWWHLKGHDKKFSSTNYIVPSFIEKEIKAVFGKLGETLSKYNLVKIVDKNAIMPYDDIPIFVYENNKPYYNHFITYPENLIKLMVEYGSNYEKAIGCKLRIEKYQHEKRLNEIADQWDSL